MNRFSPLWKLPHIMQMKFTDGKNQRKIDGNGTPTFNIILVYLCAIFRSNIKRNFLLANFQRCWYFLPSFPLHPLLIPTHTSLYLHCLLISIHHYTFTPYLYPHGTIPSFTNYLYPYCTKPSPLTFTHTALYLYHLLIPIRH